MGEEFGAFPRLTASGFLFHTAIVGVDFLAMTDGEPPLAAAPLPNRRAADSEGEYRHLISYFKYLVTVTLTALGIIIAAGSALFYKNMSDVSGAAKAAIDSTKDAASREISKIQTDASQIARTEAQKSIDEAFAKGNVQSMIERTTRERVNAAVDREIDKNLAGRISQLQFQIAETGEISNAGARLRLGFRPALDTLVEKSKSPNAYVSQYAKSTLILIGSDYETAEATGFGGASPGTKALEAYVGQLPHKTLKDVMVLIRRSDFSPHIVAAAFSAFRELSGAKISTFDIPAAEKWCADNRPKCE